MGLLELHAKLKARKRLTKEEKDHLEWFDMDKDFDPAEFLMPNWLKGIATISANKPLRQSQTTEFPDYRYRPLDRHRRKGIGTVFRPLLFCLKADKRTVPNSLTHPKLMHPSTVVTSVQATLNIKTPNTSTVFQTMKHLMKANGRKNNQITRLPDYRQIIHQQILYRLIKYYPNPVSLIVYGK